ncbi:hypothetical protein QBC38DRAFT_465260 [Podospora fimiseda]|uniref:Uncharacterized protein n=1 Tax=Podospora fimiseda TaxID=252190 RepID=A0AAN7BZ88_9PEZI|nr:hypothetical protein QBC38DRAFT_465260 [Podospora fimiseda]
MVGGSLTNLLPGVSTDMQTGMKWLSAAQNAVIDVAELGGESVCEVLHAVDEYKLVMRDAGLREKGGQHTVGAYVSPPLDTVVGTLASHTTRMTKMPPRAVVPSAKSIAVSLENVTISKFSTTGGSSFPGKTGGVSWRGEVTAVETMRQAESVTVMPNTEVTRVMQ